MTRKYIYRTLPIGRTAFFKTKRNAIAFQKRYGGILRPALHTVHGRGWIVEGT